MIDRLQRIARAIQFLRLPIVAFGLLSLASLVVILLTSVSHDGDRFLIPSSVGVLWALGTYSFIETFRLVPEKADKSLGFFARLKRRFSRAWYWLVSMIFIGTTLIAIYLTSRLVSIWLQDFWGPNP